MSKRVRLVLVAVLAVVTLALVGAAFAFSYHRAPQGAPSPSIVPVSGPVFLQVIGDSYTGGSPIGGTDAKGWARLVVAGYSGPGVPSLDLVAEGGAGYLNKGPTYNQSIPEYWAQHGKRGQSVVVVFSGLNDSYQDPATVGDAAAKFYAQIKAASPNASLIVVGPAWPGVKPMKASMPPIRDAVKAAATGAGAQFIDPIADGWFSGPDARLIGSDTTHPTDEGHKYMANKLAPIIDAAIAKAATS